MESDMQKQLEEAIKALESIPDSLRHGAGICSDISGVLPAYYIERMFESWKHFSGSVVYPVPSGVVGVGGAEAYYNSTDHYDKSTVYGKLRRSLIRHCIKFMDEDLKKLQSKI